VRLPSDLGGASVGAPGLRHLLGGPIALAERPVVVVMLAERARALAGEVVVRVAERDVEGGTSELTDRFGWKLDEDHNTLNHA